MAVAVAPESPGASHLPPLPADAAAPVVPPAGPLAAPGGGFDARYSVPARLGQPGTGSGGAAGMPPGGEPAPLVRPHAPTRRVPAVAVLAVVALVVGGWFGWQSFNGGEGPPAGTAGYLDGGGVAHEPFNQGYSARFPRTPTETSQSFSAAGVTITMQLSIIEDDQWELGVGSMDMGVALPASELEAMAEQAAAASGSALGRVTVTEHEGRPALDVDMEGPDGYPARMLVVVDGTRVLVAIVHSSSATDDLYDELVESLHLTSPVPV